MIYHTHTLPNGLRIIHRPSQNAVVYCGYALKVGSRNEVSGQEGMAHFCEHATFKGTQRRKSWHILNHLERVGGDLNAFTNKEDTVYHAAVLQQNIDRAVDILTDIVFHSTYPAVELAKEIEVICDEIESYNDSPDELIFDDFENNLFEGHALGHSILGTSQTVRTFTSQHAQKFTRQYYRPENAIFFADGNVSFDKIVKLITKATSDWEATASLLPTYRQIMPVHALKVTHVQRQKNTHQAHVMLGNRAYGVQEKKRHVLYLLNNLLGGSGMNTRLNLSLREHHGLVYTVESNMVTYSDTGYWAIYFGCDPHDVPKCMRLIRKELNQLIDKPLTNNQLLAAKKQIKGQIGVASDNRESFALGFAKTFLHHGTERNIDVLFQKIDAITPQQIQQVAQELMAESMVSTLIYM